MGTSVLAWQPVDTGGSTRSRAWRVDTPDGPVFAKEAQDDGSLAMLRREGIVYRGVGGPFLPGFVGFADDGTRATLAIELLEDARWPPPYPDDVTPLFEALELVAASPPPELPSHGPRRSRWEQVAAEPGTFLGLGVCSVTWLDGEPGRAARGGGRGRVRGERARAQRHLQRERRLHTQRRRARGLGRGRAGSRWIDVALALLSVRVEGGTPPALDFPAEPAFAAAFAGTSRWRLPRRSPTGPSPARPYART